MIKAKKYPAKVLKALKESLLKQLDDEVFFLIERTNLENGGEDIAVFDDTKPDELPLYIAGSYGELNKTLAATLLTGSKKPFLSDTIFEFVTPDLIQQMKNSTSFLEAVSYSQGKLYSIATALDQIGSTKYSGIAHKWAGLSTDL
jgi:hypothetical protein